MPGLSQRLCLCIRAGPGSAATLQETNDVTQVVTGGEDPGLLLKGALAGRPGGALHLRSTEPHPRQEADWYSPSIPGLKVWLVSWLLTQILSLIGLSPSAPLE